jgi:hypothetical protein
MGWYPIRTPGSVVLAWGMRHRNPWHKVLLGRRHPRTPVLVDLFPPLFNRVFPDRGVQSHRHWSELPDATD